MTERDERHRSIRVWVRMLAPIAAWVALAVALSHQPGWAAGTEPAPAAGPRAGAEPAVAPAGASGAGGGGVASGVAGKSTVAEKSAVGGSSAAPSATAAGEAKGGAHRPAPILYVPPSRGRAWRSAGAGTRGLAPSGASSPAGSTGAASAIATGARPTLAVLAPRDHVGQTEHPSPTLYWYLSAPSPSPIELTLVDDEAIEPLLRLRLPGPIDAGLHALPLADLGVVLPPNKVHRWFVALVHDPERRSKDELAEGAIERIAPLAPASSGSSSPPRTPEALRAAALRSAGQGLWYDALGTLSLALEQAPGDRSLAADRQALLDQAKLDLALP